MAKIRHTTDEQGNLVTQQYHNGKWYDRPPLADNEGMQGQTIGDESKLRGNMKRGPRVAKAGVMNSKKRAAELFNRGEEAKMRDEAAQEFPWYAKPGISMLDEIRGLGTGMENFGDFLEDTITGNPEAIKRTIARMKEWDKKKVRDKELFENIDPLTEAAGRSVPYLLSEGMAGPAMSARINKAVGLVGDAAKAGASKTGGRSVRALQNRAKKGDHEAQLIVDKFVDPVAKQATRSKARPPVEDYFRKGFIGDMGAMTALGAVEGATHVDDTALKGAVSSALGYGAGRVVGPRLEKGPDRLTERNRELLDWWQDKGYRPDPGMDSGIPVLQRKHSDAQRTNKYGPLLHDYEMANNQVVNKVLGEAMGLEGKSLDSMTKSALKDHVSSLRKEYDDLTLRSRGKIDKSEVRDLGKRVSDQLQNSTKKSQKANTMRLYGELANITQEVRRDSRGRILPHTFSGKTYQKLRTDIKNAADEAYDKDGASHRALKSMLETLDKSMERGITLGQGSGRAKEWKDINERWAMSKLAMDKGIDATGDVDMKKLSEHLMTKDSERLLTGEGGRVQNMHRIAELSKLKSKQQRDVFGQNSIKDDETKFKGLLGTPYEFLVPVTDRAMTRAYMAGWPQNTGLLGANVGGKHYGMKPKDTAKLLRAVEQGGDYHTGAYEKVKGAAGATGDVLGGAWSSFEELLEELKAKNNK